MRAIDRSKAIIVQLDADTELRFRFLTLARLYRGEGITAVICSLCRISASLTNSVHKPICATVSRRTGKRNVGQSCMT